MIRGRWLIAAWLLASASAWGQTAATTSVIAPASMPALTGDTTSTNGSVATTSSPLGSTRVLFYLHAANMNVTTDQAMTAAGTVPAAWVTSSIFATNCPTSLGGGLAAGGFYTAGSKGGTNLVGAAQVYAAATSAAVIVPATLVAGISTTRMTAATMFFSLTVANGGAATCDLYIVGTGLP